LALDGGEWSVSLSGLSTPRERAPGGWVNPRAGLDAISHSKQSTNESVNQTTYPANTPPANQSTDQQLSQLVNKAINHSIN